MSKEKNLTVKGQPSYRQSLIKKTVSSLPIYQTGLPENVVRSRYNLTHVACLASNENPLGVSPLAQQAAAACLGTLWKYSDPDSAELCRVLSLKTGVKHESIVIGNGSEELICLICRACLKKNDRVITVYPSFPLHEIYPLEQGAKVVGVPMTRDLHFEVDGLISEIEKGCKLLILSNPSNPAGCILSGDELSSIVKALPADALIVLDEAYWEFAAGSKDYPDSLTLLKTTNNPHVILRTFSKAYGLAGLRVGYGLFSDPWFVEQLHKLRTPFNVNAIAQVCARAALEDKDHLGRTLAHNYKEKPKVISVLREYGYRVADSYANFVFVDCESDSRSVAENLLANGVIVKPWTSSGYQSFIRVTIGKKEDNDLFLNLMKQMNRQPGTFTD